MTSILKPFVMNSKPVALGDHATPALLLTIQHLLDGSIVFNFEPYRARKANNEKGVIFNFPCSYDSDKNNKTLKVAPDGFDLIIKANKSESSFPITDGRGLKVFNSPSWKSEKYNIDDIKAIFNTLKKIESFYDNADYVDYPDKYKQDLECFFEITGALCGKVQVHSAQDKHDKTFYAKDTFTFLNIDDLKRYIYEYLAAAAKSLEG